MSTPRKTKSPASEAAPQPAAAPDNVWLAGLDALAQAQARGTQAFDALMREGLAQQAKAREAAEAQLSKAAERLQALTTGAGSAPWDRLGGIFENRVGHALERLGMPSADTVQALLQRVDALQARVDALERQCASLQSAGAKTAAKPAAKKTTASQGRQPRTRRS